MAGRRGGGGRSRLEMRKQNDAAEAREAEEEEEIEDDEEGDEDEEESDEEGDEDGGDDVAEAEGDGDAGDYDDDEDAPKPKKKAKPKKAPAEKKPKRVKAVKVVRMKAIWVVFDNAGKRVGTFPFPQKGEAEALLAAKMEEKKSPTYYIQLIKEPIEE